MGMHVVFCLYGRKKANSKSYIGLQRKATSLVYNLNTLHPVAVFFTVNNTYVYYVNH